jgi:hypothetical protein
LAEKIDQNMNMALRMVMVTDGWHQMVESDPILSQKLSMILENIFTQNDETRSNFINNEACCNNDENIICEFFAEFIFVVSLWVKK